MNNTKSKLIAYILLILSLTAGFVVLSYFTLLNHWLYQSSVVQTRLTEQSQIIDTDVRRHLLTLNERFNQSFCDDAILKAMRVADYYSTRLHEYGFVVDNKLLCTTSVGILSIPLLQPKPDLRSADNPVEFTRSSPVNILPGNETAMRLQVGNFQAFIKHDGQYDFNSQALYTSIFVYDSSSEKFVRILSTDYAFSMPISSKPSTSDTWSLDGMNWYHQFCYAPLTCALIKIDVIRFVKDNCLLFLLTLCLLLGLCVVTFAKGHASIQRYYSFNRQVKRGMNSQQIIVHYQPIICNKTNTVGSCEVLCRWQDKEGKKHGAFQFINEVIANGHETQLTEIITRKSIMEYRDIGCLGKIKLSINCFPNEVASGFMKKLLTDLLSPQELTYIVIEITEQQSSKESNINEAITELRALGVKIAIDDFGTGHSNLEQLKDLHVDYLKIDQGFIFDILHNKLHLHLVQHIVKLADEMSLICVAEGVETQAHQDLIPSLDISYSQGYFHARPMPIHELAVCLDEKSN